MKHRKALVYYETGKYEMKGISTGKRAVGSWLEGYVDDKCLRFIDVRNQELWYIQCSESVILLGELQA